MSSGRSQSAAPIFVVGFPRSGTTLVQLILAAADGLASAPETHFFTHCLPELSPAEAGNALSSGEVKAVLQRLREKPHINLDADDASIAALAAAGKATPAVLLDCIMKQLIGNRPGIRRWIEKTPRHGTRLDVIRACYPQAPIIHVVRDPRDVVSSEVNPQTYASELEHERAIIRKAHEWCAQITAELCAANIDSNILTIRYEDLIATPETTCRRVFAFIEEPWRSDYLVTFSNAYDSVITSWEDAHKQLAAAGALIDRRGIWRERMPVRYARLVERLAWSHMKKLGYRSCDPPAVAWVRSLARMPMRAGRFVRSRLRRGAIA